MKLLVNLNIIAMKLIRDKRRCIVMELGICDGFKRQKL